MANKGSAVSLGPVNERRLRPVYEHLDNANNKSALHEAEKVLKKQRDLSAAKVLKTIALHRLGRTDEAYSLSQEVALVGPTDENSLQGLSLYYREIQRPDLIPPIYEIALSKCPGNEEYLTHLFMSYVRMERPKEMQRVAITLYKYHPKNPYLFWGIMSIVMQAEGNEQLGKMMFLPLAERMIEKHIEKGKIEAEAETRLYLMILDMLGKHEKALQVLEEESAKHFSMDSDGMHQIKTEIHKKMGKWEKVNAENKNLLMKDPDIWNYILEYLDSLEHLIEKSWRPEESRDSGTSTENPDYTWDQAIEVILKVKEQEIMGNSGRPRRGPFLAVLELQKRLGLAYEKDSSLSTSLEKLGNPVHLIIEYSDFFATKPCCFNDVECFVKAFSKEQKSQFLQEILSVITSFLEADDSKNEENDKVQENKIWKHLYYLRMQRYLGHHESLERTEKMKIVEDLLQRHSKGIKYSAYRLETDIRVADDYCLLAANLLIDLYRDEGDTEYLWRAVYILELAKQKSVVNFKFKFTLIRLYCEVGIFLPCAQIYDSLDIKHMQQDTMGYIISNSVASLGHYQLASQAFEASRAFYISNEKDLLEFLISCFRNGTFHKVSEFISFRDRVKNSLYCAITITEHTYMDLVTQADIDVPFYDLLMSCCLPKKMTDFEKLLDNRDFAFRLDWTPANRYLTDSHIRSSFDLEKKWLQFRETQVRAIIALLKQSASLTTTEDQNNHVDINSLLDKLEKSVEETKELPDLNIKFPFHGPPEPRIKSALAVGYQDLNLKLFRLFKNILNEISNPKTENELKEISKSIIEGIEGALTLTGLVSLDSKSEVLEQSHRKKKSTKHDHGDHDDDNVACVMSSPEKTTESALTLPVPNILKELRRDTLERLVSTCELYSLCVLLVYNFNSKIKSEFTKKRRKKKGKQEPTPAVVQFYQEFVSNLTKIGQKVKSAVIELRSRAEVMTLDLSITDLKPEEKLSNGDIQPMQSTVDATPTKDTPNSSEVHVPADATPLPGSGCSDPQTTPTLDATPIDTTPLPDQLIKIASESLVNATNQILDVVEGRLGNLKAIKL